MFVGDDIFDRNYEIRVQDGTVCRSHALIIGGTQQEADRRLLGPLVTCVVLLPPRSSRGVSTPKREHMAEREAVPIIEQPSRLLESPRAPAIINEMISLR